MDSGRPLLVAQLENRGMLARFVRAALLHEVALVPLAEPPRKGGAHTLQLRVLGGAGITLVAEPAGAASAIGFPLRLRPLDPSHVAELDAIVKEEEPSLQGLPPISASGSAIFAEFPPLPSGAAHEAPRSTVPDDVPSPRDALDASVVFDPEAVLIGRAPPRRAATEAGEDTLTVPLRALASAPPPSASDLRTTAVSGPPQMTSPSSMRSVRPSAPPLPRDEPAEPPLPALPEDPKITAVPKTNPSAGVAPPEPIPPSQASATAPSRLAPSGMTNALAPSDERESSISISVELDSVTSASTRRAGSWTSEADVPDPSLAAGVVIDPDILARERTSARPPPPYAASARGEDEISVEIDMRTTQERLADDVKEIRAAIEKRRDASLPVDEDEDEAETLVRDSQRPASSASRSSRRNGPRTIKRTQLDVVGGRTIANKYRIQSLVGSGAVGAVYKAAHTDLERTVAIKVLHPHYRADPHLMQSFRAEARAASLLHHPNVTIVHDFGEEPDGLVYIVMEYLQGWTLQTVLDEERRLGAARARSIMLQVCAALSAAHDRGIVHRDVKPDNIILVPTRDDEGAPFEMVKVCDFGIAALETLPGDDDDAYTAGTPEYMAPEQAAGRADARTDVYACGIVLYEMITGRPPFVGDGPVATLRRHATEAPRRPSELVPDVPRGIEGVILRALEKAPERRYPTMRDMRADLKRNL